MSKRGGRKSVHGDGVDRVTGLTLIFRCGMFDALFFLVKKYGGGMMLVYYQTYLGVGNMMVSLKITENAIIKVLLAILGSWRWGPYVDPDL